MKILDSVKKTEESLKKFKATRKQPNILGGSASTSNLNSEISDEDKIRTQFSLDATCFGEEVASLGIDIATNVEFQAFKLMIKDTTTA